MQNIIFVIEFYIARHSDLNYPVLHMNLRVLSIKNKN